MATTSPIKSNKQSLITFLVTHFCVWTLLPLLRPNIPMDSAEAIVWGQDWLWGTNKHPPISGWMADLSFSIFPSPDFSMYILSQICILIGFVFIYKLARCFVCPGKSLLATLFLEGTFYYTLSSPEFNVNVISLMCVPMMVYFFYRAIHNHRILYWAATGVVAGLTIMTKYSNGLFVLGMIMYLLMTSTGRKQFKSIGLYIAGVCGAIVCLPHAVWLINHDFYTVDYFLTRSGANKHIWTNHLFFPIKFFLAQGLAVFGTLILFTLTYFKSAKSMRRPRTRIPNFLWFLGVFPLCAWMIISLFTGAALKSMWGTPLFFALPLILFTAFPFYLSNHNKRRSIRSTYITMALFALIFTCNTLFHTGGRTHFPGRLFTQTIETLWTKQYGAPLAFVGGDIWLTSNVSVYSSQRPRVLIDMNPHVAPWIDVNSLKNKGAVVLASNPQTYKSYRSLWPDLSEPILKEIKFNSHFGKHRHQTIYVGFIPPQGEQE